MEETRMERLFRESRELGKNQPRHTYDVDLHGAALGRYKDLPTWEKIARSHAAAIVNQQVSIKPYDRLIGRVYYENGFVPEKKDPIFDFKLLPEQYARQEEPAYRELADIHLGMWGIPGHIAWNWNLILREGTEGIRRRCLQGMARKKGDEKAQEFYSGVLILLEAVEQWNDLHVAKLEEMGMAEEAAICRRVPRYPARSFREALQSYFFQHIVVMKENPHGGNSPGRLDYFLWPYLEQDLKTGKCTLEEAQELVEELFIRIEERIFHVDTWGESVVVGGCHPNGTSAVNPLSYIMIRAFMKYDLTHPYFYVRLPKDPPEDFVELCAEYIRKGQNRAQILNDENIIAALLRNGVSYSDAVDYYCGGCMEIGVQGKTSDFLFVGYFSIPKLLELCMTGGYCLRTHRWMDYFRTKSLAECADFEEFYAEYLAQAKQVMHASFAYIDRLGDSSEVSRPCYLLCSMLDDCMTKGRNMHAGGARYYDYGASMIGIPNAADSLYAIKRAIFDEKICTVEELLAALEADFVGYERLHAQLKRIPKYGMDHAEADEMAARLTRDLCAVFDSYINRLGGTCKPVILSFVWSPEAGDQLGATPDGRKAGVPVAHAVTPQSAAMTQGITSAINSCVKMPFECFTGGASTMWDLDENWASQEVVKALLQSFFSRGGHMFQGNVTSVEELYKAQQDPDSYPNLIVRVGGFSARFTRLSKSLQDDIINRIRHSC